MNTLGDYRKLTRKLIKRYFPSLKTKKLIVLEYFYPNISSAGFFRLINLYFIFIHPRIKSYPISVIEGILIHELSHMREESSKSYLSYLRDYIKYWVNKRYREKVERDADIYAIKLGYGNELIKLREIRLKNAKSEKERKKLKKRLKNYYISIDEIKKIMKTMKKS